MKINLGSGQRRFEGNGWINIDCLSRPPDQIPDIIADGRFLPFPGDSIEVVVSIHNIEHYGCGESQAVIKEVFRVLKSGGVFLVSVPDMRKLAQRWLLRQITDQIYMTCVYGAYQGEEGDRHKWGFVESTLKEELLRCAAWKLISVLPHDETPMEVPVDWWILNVRAVK